LSGIRFAELEGGVAWLELGWVEDVLKNVQKCSKIIWKKVDTPV
jgi:hypothetical protein